MLWLLGILHLLSLWHSDKIYLFSNFAGMKRFLDILSVMLLSLLLIMASVGTSIATCSHSGRMEATQTAIAQDSHNCHGMKNCMVVKTVKLAPGTLAQHTAFDFSQPWTAVLPSILLIGLMLTFVPTRAICEYWTVRTAPPRDYLHRLRVLRLWNPWYNYIGSVLSDRLLVKVLFNRLYSSFTSDRLSVTFLLKDYQGFFKVYGN